MALDFDFYYGNEAEQYSFYRIPRVLFTDNYFKCLSTDSKLLYGLLLDRMGLSIKNGWMDERGRVFIYYSREEIQADLDCGRDKAGSLLAELDTAKGIGLIERVKQGQGRPTKIFVKRFTSPGRIVENTTPPKGDSPDADTSGVKITEKPLSEPPPTAAKEPELPTSEARPPVLAPLVTPERGESVLQTTEKQWSRQLKISHQDYGKTAPSNTNVNQTYLNQLYPSPSMPPGVSTEGAGGRERCRENLREQLSYPLLCEKFSPGEVDSLVDLLADALCSRRPTLRVNSGEVPMAEVRERLAQLDFTHIEYAFDCLRQRTQPVGNLRGYLLTLLYNAPVTMEQYYDLEVQRDLAYGLLHIVPTAQSA